MARTQYVHTFGEGRAQGSAGMKDLLGGKGAGLAEMAQLGLPVPPGFTISTQAVKLLRSGVQRQEIEVEVEAGLRFVEQCLDRRFGDAQSPLLVSVRSGAAVSMPGMMDTVLNIGLNPETIVGLTRASSNERFAWDSYRRLIQMYGEIVLGLEHAGEQEQSPFAVLLATAKERRGVTSDLDLTAADLQELAGEYESCIERLASRSFPAAPREQLWDTIMAVCDSWDNSRARTYRQIHGIPEDLGTAINVQAMVYGNLGSESGTGVMFTRNPANGERELYGEFLMNAQGEDVVAG
ncbi:MAG TPA: PEP/pyruvate-binding domain-containing protein, partial [bacterium]|nr:PEP/pyruvate-binding domain-containing protein [bacterium]